MLPSVVASELQDSVHGFLRSAFPIATPFFQGTEGDSHALIDGLIERTHALFRGPYLDLKLPFRAANSDHSPFRHVSLSINPYRHQQQAFERLAGAAPRSTIIATGTGSGKTECFLLPVLDDCLERRERGIKSLVIYPMNALATDQARRFAQEVARLDTRLTVGLYVGGEQARASRAMTPDRVITDRQTLRKNPPDILLTNYKMLDFLLIRPEDQPLWRFNSPGMLRYLVVDELHTFDGAQGTDLACLIRRLRDRLGAGRELACVGTSATMGSGSADTLRQYASQVFATDFDEDSIIEEDRLSAAEYLPDSDSLRYFAWPVGQHDDLDFRQYRDMGDYLLKQALLWFPGLDPGQVIGLVYEDKRQRAEAATRLGKLLLKHNAFHELVRAAETLVDMTALAENWRDRLGLEDAAHARAILDSLLSLVSAARQWNDRDSADDSQWCKPLLQVSCQLWLRELTRMVCRVPVSDQSPELAFSDDLKDPANPLHLPLLHCRECHLAAWGAVVIEGSSDLNGDLQTFYRGWFQNAQQTRVLVPLTAAQADDATGAGGFCPHCRRLQLWKGPKSSCDGCEREALVPVWVPDMTRKVQRGGREITIGHHDCPGCAARDGLMIVGYRAAMLGSTMVGRLFSTPYNDDRKLIAFSDSVQDAAHRAGFMGASTWRQVIRQAMALWLARQSRPLSLERMSAQLPGFWRQKLNNDARYSGLFIAPNMLWWAEYDELQQTGKLPPGCGLADSIDRRLGWECIAEFGRRGTLGRSLERTGEAAVFVDAQRLFEDLKPTLARLREEIEGLRQLPDEAFQAFVLGWLHHVRQTGAIYHHGLKSYLLNKGREFQINRILWMPSFGRGRRPPSAVTLAHVARNFEAQVLGNRETWAVAWLKKTLARDQVLVAAESRQIYSLLLEGLEKTGWLVSAGNRADGRDNGVFQLDPRRLLVTRNVAHAVCSHCSQTVVFGAEAGTAYEGLCCLRRECSGRLRLSDRLPEKRDFGLERPHRLVPHEHTGLLTREKREQVENSFVHGAEPWHINLLSATPTLEMGIDIGALSSVMLCSVPPAQANYLQRIGRAGRRDGNALSITVANGREHDLYFFADPLEMMAGAVRTPGVFLEARAVLERQLVAYCLGDWSSSEDSAGQLPAQMRAVINAVEQQQTDRFPYSFLQHVKKHHARLLDGFFNLFDGLKNESQKYLASVIHGTGAASGRDDRVRALDIRLIDRIQDLVEQRRDLKNQIRRLKSEYERLMKMPVDDKVKNARKTVWRERTALQALDRAMNNQQVLEFFTDEGLLPNYAFPEEGVTLKSVIVRRGANHESTAEGNTTRLSYSFQRPAQAALGELAPESRFYAVSHKLPIDRIDLQLSRVEKWRFCDRCQYSARVDVGDEHSACPRCGSPQWVDSGQKHTVLRLRQVYSTVDDRDSRIGDDAEQRQPQFFNRQMLVDVPPESQSGGFRLRSEILPFGFEYLRRISLREVNFGVPGSDGKRFFVAGQEMPRRGFRICSHCGTVQKERPGKFDRQHTWTCRLNNDLESATPEDFIDSLYLYRELDSEAIRILLPLSDVAYSDVAMHSFIAALHLGLREYFHGDVHHLEVTRMHEPATLDGSEKHYLIVYDRIPGGTGYLKELMNRPENLMRVLKLAHSRLTGCSCIDEDDEDSELDGCYRCILAYRDSRNMPVISRQGAADLLARILRLADDIKPVESISAINTNTLVESELEQKLVDALRALPSSRMSERLVNGSAGYLLTLKGSDGRPVAWQVQHQVLVGPSDGVALETRIDLLLTPARDEDAGRYRPIAVYMDGLQYHRDRVDDDVRKRTALLVSGQYWVFSLNWDDLPAAGQALRPPEPDLLRREGVSSGELRDIYDSLAEGAGWTAGVQASAALECGSLARLEQLLRAPERATGEEFHAAVLRGLTALCPAQARNDEAVADFGSALVDLAPPSVLGRFLPDSEPVIPGGFLDVFGNAVNRLSLACSLPQNAVSNAGSIAESLRVHLCFDDRRGDDDREFKAAWRAFWHAANQLQFLPGFSMSTRRAVDDGSLESTRLAALGLRDERPPTADSAARMDDGWNEVAELVVFLEPKDVQALAALDIPVPEVGLDLPDASGGVAIGGDQIELCWPEARLALVSARPDVDLPGWQLIGLEEGWLQQIEKLKTQEIFS